MVDSTINDPNVKDISNCIKARYDAGIENQRSVGTAVIEPKIKIVGHMDGYEQSGRVYNPSGIACTLRSRTDPMQILEYKINEPKIKRLGNLYDENAGGARAGNTYDPDGLAPALQTAQGGNRQPLMYENYRIRKLTPKECFRLMGFTDEEFNRIQGISNTQLYKMAGNSICVPVLEAIFKQLFKETTEQ